MKRENQGLASDFTLSLYDNEGALRDCYMQLRRDCHPQIRNKRRRRVGGAASKIEGMTIGDVRHSFTQIGIFCERGSLDIKDAFEKQMWNGMTCGEFSLLYILSMRSHRGKRKQNVTVATS